MYDIHFTIDDVSADTQSHIDDEEAEQFQQQIR